MRRCNSIAFQVASGVIIACAIVSTIVKARAAAPPAAVSWDGDCANQLWSQLCGVGNGTTNWSTDNLPTLADDVAIPMGAPVVRVVGQASAKTISCQSGLSSITRCNWPTAARSGISP